MIEVQGVTHFYHHKKVLDQVDVTIYENEVCALVGRNGSGKSTLIHCLLHLLPPSQGTIRLNGILSYKEGWKKDVAYLPEKFQLYPQLTCQENMKFFASLSSMEVDEQKIEEKLRMVQLWEHRDEVIKGFSKGMLQRLGLGIMLYYETKILILDEPTSGLDPIGRKEILSILKSLTGKTVLFSSHHMDEIRQICTHVAYLENGRIQKYEITAFCKQFQFGE
ncbi:ABC transporter ATP-binding protein [Aneurinibacillus migulanus]|uniref:ABC transporter ATP-binding protein n=1 Tax=Aneurinibacillus migulanus TaxID=47500 RepID=A0A0D1V3W4_ANEMI|nr:ABC transporter ATP-binding protein [Aneurinibacillus migulanus]KIV54049.1 ABC transporter ATP-binding protein [Aneurinibacillus migulanus]KON97708.1 ABC transporter ATP-binding protein [Aneurinibacillus migulanus]MED0894477.1 ABC transporter ATP-binding protein [Aneurinibacillus migulanus]MED1617087.1 ABC transporter ATP-binding protein [Aneurinibacillus migulanus]SDJ34120.1 ABC-2 type transport system ATP-binding protein [Aneurinibacillus migulanus]